ncbi:hypothetical protein GCM10010441_09740 [Kitasatospora paracochleata]
MSGTDWTGIAEDTDGLPAAVWGVSAAKSTGRPARPGFTRLPPSGAVTAGGGPSLHRTTVRPPRIRQVRAAWPTGRGTANHAWINSGPPVCVAGAGPPWDRAPVLRSGQQGTATPDGDRADPEVRRPVPVPTAAPPSSAPGVRPCAPHLATTTHGNHIAARRAGGGGTARPKSTVPNCVESVAQ